MRLISTSHATYLRICVLYFVKTKRVIYLPVRRSHSNSQTLSQKRYPSTYLHGPNKQVYRSLQSECSFRFNINLKVQKQSMWCCKWYISSPQPKPRSWSGTKIDCKRPQKPPSLLSASEWRRIKRSRDRTKTTLSLARK